MSPESDKTEYKRELPAADKLEKEVIAFLNTDGGKIYFGIDDNGNTTGIADPDDLQLKLKDRIKNNISEHALEYCSITVEELNKKHIVVLTVLSGWEKPFYLNKYGMTPKGCFKRVGSSTEPIPVAQIEMIFSKRVRNSLKNIPSPVVDLTFQQLKIYYQEKGKTLNDRFLDSLNLTTYDGKPNYAAYLLADENRNSIMFAKYADTTRVDLISNELMGDYCLIKSFERLMDRLTAENITFTKITPRRRIERNLIDKVALREAVLNALIHNGQQELLYKMLNHYDVPGYGYQIKLGHTTLTEQWNPDMGASMNHFMMAHIENFLIPDLLGIQRTGDLIEIQPHPVSDIVWCKGSTMSAFGMVKVEWRIHEGVFTIDIDIPEGGFADVYMPFSNHAESLTEGHHRLTEKINKQ